MQEDEHRPGQRRFVGRVRQLPIGADASADQSADHQHRQNGWLSNLSEPGVARCVDRFCQIVGNERPRSQSRWRLRTLWLTIHFF